MPFSAIVTILPFPSVTSIAPTSGGYGDQITITGTDLSAPGWPPTVFFTDLQASPLISVSATEIVVGAPTFSTLTDFGVTVVVGPLASDIFAFSLDTLPFVEAATEPNNSGATAPVTTLPFDVEGSVDAGDLDDFFRITFDRELDLVIDLVWPNANADLDILIRDGADANYVCSFGGATGANPEQATCTMPAGEYLVWVNNYNAEATEYRLQIDVSNP